MLDGSQYVRNVARELLVDEAQHVITLRTQKGIACSIVTFAAFVKRAIKFDDESALQAHKIDDKGLNEKLTLEFVAGELAIANARPEEIFRRDGFVPHLLRAVAVRDVG